MFPDGHLAADAFPRHAGDAPISRPHPEANPEPSTPESETAELRARRALERIPGVAAARVALGRDGGGLEHALLALRPEASDADVRAVAVAVLAALGLRAVSEDLSTQLLLEEDGARRSPPQPRPPTARSNPAAPAELPARAQAAAPGRAAGGSPRILLRRDLRVERREGQATCRVELFHEGSLRTGEATDLDTPLGRARAAARATLRAAQAIRPERRLELEGVVFVELFGRPQLVVSVEATAGREHTFLTGVVTADASVEDGGCLATLRAVERWLSR